MVRLTIHLVSAQATGKGMAKGRWWERNVVEKLPTPRSPRPRPRPRPRREAPALPAFLQASLVSILPTGVAGPPWAFQITLGPERTGRASERTPFPSLPLKCWGFHAYTLSPPMKHSDGPAELSSFSRLAPNQRSSLGLKQPEETFLWLSIKDRTLYCTYITTFEDYITKITFLSPQVSL